MKTITTVNGKIIINDGQTVKTYGGPGSGHHGHSGRPGVVGGSGSGGGGGGDVGKEFFNSKQLNDLESKISNLLPEPIEFISLDIKNKNYFGSIRWDKSDKNESGRGTITFRCGLESNKVIDLKIINTTGGMRGIDQSIFD